MNQGILNILRVDGRCWSAEVSFQSVPVPPRSSRLVQARIKDVPEEGDAPGVCALRHPRRAFWLSAALLWLVGVIQRGE